MSTALLRRLTRIESALMPPPFAQGFKCFYFDAVDRGENQAEAERMAKAQESGAQVLKVTYHDAGEVLQ